MVRVLAVWAGLGLLLATLPVNVAAQTISQLVGQLHAVDWPDRAAALESLTSLGALRDPQVHAALLATLELENSNGDQVLRDSAGTEGPSVKFGEGYSSYYSELVEAVAGGANTSDPATLRALVRSRYNPDSRFAVDLAATGDGIAASLIERSESDIALIRQTTLAFIGQIVGIINPASLSETSRFQLVQTLAAGVVDSDDDVKAQAFDALQLADTIPPTIEAVRTPAPNFENWNNTAVTIAFNCVDALSGLAPGSPPPPTLLSTQGQGQTATGSCQDLAGRSTSLTVSDINIDTTSPSISAIRSPLANEFGWNNTAVTVSFSCADALSGVASCGPSPEVLSTEGAGQSVTGIARDKAGNDSISVMAGINIDKVSPSISCDATPAVLWPPNNQMIPIDVSVSLSDGGAGPNRFSLISVTSNEPGAGQIEGFALGSTTRGLLQAQRRGSGSGRVYSLLYEGTDRAGNTARCLATVTVPHNK